nr:DUF6701 domain-containing protein [uncultured Rhodoferax sp.]
MATLIRHIGLLALAALGFMAGSGPASAVTIEFNSTGGTTATNGLRFYIEDTTKIQVRRLNNTGQVYAPGAVPPSNSLDNGIFIRANGLVYGPSHTVSTFNPTGGMYSTRAITATSPANPATSGMQQTATGTFGITAGPQVSVLWKYTTPLDFLTAEVTLTIPAAYPISAANPVRYYHVFDTYLGGSDNGCGFTYVDATSGDRFVGTYQPTSGTCTTTSAIPAGINVVESFRERTGLPFTAYCASGWNSFFANGSTNCSVLQAANMSNALQATFADTGIGIQYSFTAPGVYTFSYDFVIGSPNVPPYDHLEIRHDGSGSLCPESVTVLACTSATVPCPALDIVNTGTLTGSVTTSPAAPAVTKTPASFSVGSANTTQSIVLQAAAGGAVTLGTSGLSTTPLNGTKCWNTANSTQSCTMTFAATPCVSGYECLETGVAYNNLVTTPAARNPLYTKLSGTNFLFDVVALQSSGAIATTYTAAANVTVELFDDSTSPAPACSAYTSPVASQAITFVAGDNGRKTLSTNINLPNAYSKLRCRVRDTNITPTLHGCSSDTFAVRPQQFTVSSTNANADAAGTNTAATPTVKASAAFNLTANTSTVGYNGTPVLNTANAAAHTGAIQTGTVAGTFSAASAATGNGATGAAFTYGEVGYFRLNANGVVDSNFTTVDSPLNDCVAGSSSNTLVGGKYGCNVGNAVSPYFGRFIPDRFDTVVAQSCNSFTYSGQPFAVTVTAMNGAATPAITQNYDGTTGSIFSKATALSPVASAGGTAIPAATGTLASGATTAASFRRGTTAVAGTVAVTNGSTTVTGTGTLFSSQLATGGSVCISSVCYTIASIGSNTALTLANAYTGINATGLTMQMGQTFTFTNRQTAPTGVFVRAIDSESVSSLRAVAASSVEGGTTVRSGRFRLSNAYGSELLNVGLDLPTAAVEFYDVSPAGWRAGPDFCTNLTAANFAFTAAAPACTGAIASCTTALSATRVGTGPYTWTVNLSKPNPVLPTSMCVTLNLDGLATGLQCTATGTPGPASTSANAPWLRYGWKSATETDPAAAVNFGTYKSPLIYRRENY